MEDKYNSDDKITLVQDTPITSLGSEINVDVSETNLTVDHIEIYKGNKKVKKKIKE